MHLTSLAFLGLMALALPGYAQLKSHYTPVDAKECALEDASSLLPESQQVIDSYSMECPGMGGYEVIVSGVDMRYALSLRHADRTIRLWQPPSFHELGATRIEWRYQVIGNPGTRLIRYRALIYRLNDLANHDSGTPRKRTQLVVVRLQGAGTCVIGLVPQGATMNERARELADDLSRPCLKP